MKCTYIYERQQGNEPLAALHLSVSLLTGRCLTLSTLLTLGLALELAAAAAATTTAPPTASPSSATTTATTSTAAIQVIRCAAQ